MISLDLKDKRPIYEQVMNKFKELMAMGILPENSQLPSVRTLACELSINPNTIQRAYAELERQGYIYSVKGRGSFVTECERLRDLRIDEVKEELINIVEEACSLGVNDEEIIKVVKRAIGTGEVK